MAQEGPNGAACSRRDVGQLEEVEESADPTQLDVGVNSADELSALLPHVPLGENGELTSVFSIKHAGGSCKPCTFFYTRVGCEKHIRCQFCHIPHRSKDRRRQGKKKRERYRDLISRTDSSNPGADRELPWQPWQNGRRGSPDADWELPWQNGRRSDQFVWGAPAQHHNADC